MIQFLPSVPSKLLLMNHGWKFLSLPSEKGNGKEHLTELHYFRSLKWVTNPLIISVINLKKILNKVHIDGESISHDILKIRNILDCDFILWLELPYYLLVLWAYGPVWMGLFELIYCISCVTVWEI